jgi:hypothetical protein
MAYMITAECINCSACEMDCPVRAIMPAASQYACVPARETYLFKARALAHRGAPPLIYRPAGPAAEAPHG